MRKNEKLLEEIYQLDPLIKRAALKLENLSKDEEVLINYCNREAELAKRREMVLMEEIKQLFLTKEIYLAPSKYQIKLKELVYYSKEKGIPISSLSKKELMMFVEESKIYE
jgi:hypothetical protein